MAWGSNVFPLIIITAGGKFTGLFIYSPHPGPGNLIDSIAAQPGTDPFGNAYLAGIASYNRAVNQATVLAGGELDFVENIATDATIGAFSQFELLPAENLVALQAGFGFLLGSDSVTTENTVYLVPTGDTTGAKDTALLAHAFAIFSDVRLFPGTYYLSAPIAQPSDSTLAGAGNNATILQAAAGFTGPMVELAATNTQNVTIRDLKLNGNNVAGVTHGVDWENTGNNGGHLAENVFVTGVGGGPGGGGGDGFHATDCPDSKWVNCHALLNLAGNGFSPASDMQVSGCTAQQNFGHGFNVQGVNNQLVNNKAYESGWNGTTYAGTTSCGIYCNAAYNTIAGNSCQQNALHGIELDGTSGTNAFTCTVTGNECDTNSIAALNVGSGILINQAQDCIVIGNTGANNAGIPGSQLWGIQMVGNCTATIASPNTVGGSSGSFTGSTGFNTASLAAGFASPGGVGTPGPASWKSWGDVVLLKGQVSLTANQPAFTTIFTLPPGAVPHFTHGFVTPNTLNGFAFPGAPNAIVVTNGGAVQIGAAGVTGNVVDLTGIVIPLD